MTKMTVTFGVLLAGALLPAACSDLGSDVVPTQPTVQSFTLIPKPDFGRIGSTVSIQDSRFTTSWQYWVTFRGADEALIVNCDTSATLKFFVPFGAVSGSISVQMGDRIEVSSPFTVTESSDTLQLTVAHYDITPPITASDASVLDRMGNRQFWSADVRRDTIHISRRYATGEIIYEQHFLLLDAGANQLPRLIIAWTVMHPDYPATEIDTIRTGIMKVQHWDTSAVMSGRFFGRPSIHYILNGTVPFWVDRGH